MPLAKPEPSKNDAIGAGGFLLVNQHGGLVAQYTVNFQRYKPRTRYLIYDGGRYVEGIGIILQ